MKELKKNYDIKRLTHLTRAHEDERRFNGIG
jgi:hypothetical protein